MPRKPVAPSAPLTLAEIAKAGDRRATLEAMRDQLARQMAEADTNVVAQIAARLQAILNDIAAIPDESERSIADDLAQRRANRIAAAASRAPAAEPAQ